MINRVSTVRKLLFLLFCHLALLPPRIHIPGVLGVSINTHVPAWDGSTDFSDASPLGGALAHFKGRGGLM